MEASGQTDTLRERTISALVELFKEKEKSLRDWRDPRFVTRQGQSKGDAPAEPDLFSIKPSNEEPKRESVSFHSKENQQLEADSLADKSKVMRLSDVRPFDQITPPREIDYKGLVKEELKSTLKTLVKARSKPLLLLRSRSTSTRRSTNSVAWNWKKSGSYFTRMQRFRLLSRTLQNG